MALSAADVRVGVTGEIFYAATAPTAIPTDATTALDAAFDGLGYNSEAGVTETIDQARTEIKAWQNADTVRVVRTSHSVKYSGEFLETNAGSLKVAYGADATASAVEVKAAAGLRGPWVIEVFDDDQVCRVVIPDGEVTTPTMTVTYVSGDAVKYPFEITCYPDSAGVKAYKYYGVTT